MINKHQTKSGKIGPIKAVIFDFDGLIIDTEWPAFAAWSAIYREFGAELKLENWVACVGSSQSDFDPVTHLGELTGRAFHASERSRLFSDKEARKAKECDQLQLLPGVLARITEARELGLKVGMASSSAADWVLGHLRRLELTKMFDVVRTKDDVTRVKPHPDVYLAALAGLATDPSECLAFEDSRNGVLAARAAGIRCFAVPNAVTRGLDFSVADGVFNSLVDVSLQDYLG